MMGEAVIAYLEASALGTVNTDLFVNGQPDEPDSIVTAYEPAIAFDPTGNRLKLDTFGLRIVVRAKEYRAARDRSVAIHKRIVGFGGVLASGHPVVSAIRCLNAPYSLGRDERDRQQWAANYSLLVESTGDAHRSD